MIHLRSPSRHAAQLFTLLLALFVLPASAQAQSICVSPASWVPGLSGPPQWYTASDPQYQKLNDPRWRGATRRGYPDGSETTQALVRALVSGNYLYLSMQTQVDPDGPQPTFDGIYVGLADSAASGSHLFRVFLSDVTAGNGKAAGATQVQYRPRAAGAATWGANDVGAPEAGALQDRASWIGGSAAGLDLPPGEWAINFRIDLSQLGITGDFRLWYAVFVEAAFEPSLSVVTHTWPRGVPVGNWGNSLDPDSPATGDDTVVANIDPSAWADVTLGTTAAPCADGITIQSSQIGTTGSVSSQIRTDGPNTFRATPTYNTYPSSALPPVTAKFRLANWGTTIADRANAPWTTLSCAGDPDCQADGVSVLRTSPTNGTIDWTCRQPTASGPEPVCPQYSSAIDDHQCLLVELGGGANFAIDSAYRNMDFVPASEYSRVATVSLKGVSGPAEPRDVFLHVKRRNMPAHGKEPQELPREKMIASQRALGGASPRALSEKEGRALLQRDRGSEVAAALATAKTPYERLVEVWPTYEVHAFYDSGQTMGYHGKEHRRLTPMVPFGFHVSHAGELFGFSDELTGEGGTVVEKLATDFYRLRIKPGEEARIRTTVRAHDDPVGEKQPPVGTCPDGTAPSCQKACPDCPKPKCSCDMPGGAPGSTSWWLLGLALLGLVVLARQRMRRS